MGATGAVAASGVAGGISQFGNAYVQAQAAKTQGAYQRQQYEFNARMANLQAEDSIRRGDKEAKAHKKKVKGLIGSQRAAMAAQGIEVNADSALDIQADTAAQGAADALQIKNNAWREAWGYRVAAASNQGQGAFAYMAARHQAKNTLVTGGIQAANSFTSSAAYAAGGRG